jgi:hypothetical protein
VHPRTDECFEGTAIRTRRLAVPFDREMGTGQIIGSRAVSIERSKSKDAWSVVGPPAATLGFRSFGLVIGTRGRVNKLIFGIRIYAIFIASLYRKR